MTDSVTLEIARYNYSQPPRTVEVPLDMWIEAHLHLSLEYPWQSDDIEVNVISVRPLKLNHQVRDEKGKFTKNE